MKFLESNRFRTNNKVTWREDDNIMKSRPSRIWTLNDQDDNNLLIIITFDDVHLDVMPKRVHRQVNFRFLIKRPDYLYNLFTRLFIVGTTHDGLILIWMFRIRWRNSLKSIYAHIVMPRCLVQYRSLSLSLYIYLFIYLSFTLHLSLFQYLFYRSVCSYINRCIN